MSSGLTNPLHRQQERGEEMKLRASKDNTKENINPPLFHDERVSRENGEGADRKKAVAEGETESGSVDDGGRVGGEASPQGWVMPIQTNSQ